MWPIVYWIIQTVLFGVCGLCFYWLYCSFASVKAHNDRIKILDMLQKDINAGYSAGPMMAGFNSVPIEVHRTARMRALFSDRWLLLYPDCIQTRYHYGPEQAYKVECKPTPPTFIIKSMAEASEYYKAITELQDQKTVH